jgi:RNA polymerase sigma-70 factor (ECF subfamily)
MKRRRRVGEPASFVSIEQNVAETHSGADSVDPADQSRPIDQRMIDGWMGARLRAALTELPPLYRMVLIMREMEGLSTKEVATVTGISEATVKTRLHRARVMLRQKLEAK